MSPRPTLRFVVDAGPEIGGGHVMRCLTLAQALDRRGFACRFEATPAVADLLDRFAPPAVGRTAPGEDDGAVALIFDHYGLGEADHRARAAGRPCVVLDDLADRPLGADLLVDPGPGRAESDYDGLVPAGARRLIGPAFAPVRPEFFARRAETLRRRAAETGPARRILVTLGLTDVNAVTGRVTGRLWPRLGEAVVDVVLGSGSPSLPALARLAERDPRVRLHVDSRAMAELTAEADLAVGAGGSGVWERATLGLPTLLLVLADNQRPAAEALARLGAAEVLEADRPDFDAAFDRAFAALARSAERRAGPGRRSAELCDGLGAERVADAVAERALR